MKEQAFVTYTLHNSRKPVGQGATEPEIGELAAIIKQDTNESRAQIIANSLGRGLPRSRCRWRRAFSSLTLEDCDLRA